MRMRVFLITLTMRRLISPVDEAAFRRNRRRPQSTQIDPDDAQIQAVVDEPLSHGVTSDITWRPGEIELVKGPQYIPANKRFYSGRR